MLRHWLAALAPKWAPDGLGQGRIGRNLAVSQHGRKWQKSSLSGHKALWKFPLNSHLAMTAALWRGMAEQLALWIYKRLSGENAALRLAGATANDVKRHARRWHSLRKRKR